MSARPTMTTLIETLRGLADAGTADYTVCTAVFWDAVQLQNVLDRHRVLIYQEPLVAHPAWGAGGTPIYRDYQARLGNFETTDAGTAIFVVEDGSGADAGTALWSADYAQGLVTFAANTMGSAYYVTGRSYDLNAAAADVWRMKAAKAAKKFDFSTDNHSLQRSQLYKHCLQMAEFFDGQAAPVVTTLYRSDAW